MKRRHLFEFNDQSWLPAILRDAMTDYLEFVTNLFDFYTPVIPLLEQGLRAAGKPTMIDLASGGGGGLRKLADHLHERVPDLRIVLTDAYPNKAAFKRTIAHRPDVFSAVDEPVDARDVPRDLEGLRTQFLSIHHFREEEVRRILENAVAAGAPIAFFEAQKRDAAHVVKFSLSFIFVLLLTPFIRPFRISRLLFTYLIPVLPLMVAFDGVVSVMRTYTPDELRAVIARVEGAERYSWEVGERTEKQVTLITLLGYPRERETIPAP